MEKNSLLQSYGTGYFAVMLVTDSQGDPLKSREEMLQQSTKGLGILQFGGQGDFDAFCRLGHELLLNGPVVKAPGLESRRS